MLNVKDIETNTNKYIIESFNKNIMLIKGKIINTLGRANETLKKQRKYFLDLGLPNVKKMYSGTINLKLNNS